MADKHLQEDGPGRHPQLVEVALPPSRPGWAQAGMVTGVTGIILAGGRSRRMGMDKAFLKVGEHSLVKLALEALRQIVDEVIIVTNAPARYVRLETRLTTDLFPGCGAFGGLYSGLSLARHKHALAVACDMPFLSLSLLRYMIGLPRDYEVLVPMVGHNLEPLHAIYSRSSLRAIERLLQAGRFSILDLFDQVAVRYLTEEEIERYDPEHRSFFNINTPEQLREAETIIRRSAGELIS